MLNPAANPGPFIDALKPAHGYWLSDVRLSIPDTRTAIFTARLNGPAGSPVWARAWLSTEAGTLAEAASEQMTSGDQVTLRVSLSTDQTPENACMRIESSPLRTEHVVVFKLS